MSLLEQVKSSKELIDIVDDYIKIESLLKENDFDELKKHIATVSDKHMLETVVYNMVNPCVPTTVQQNGLNCLAFLNQLFVEKTGEAICNIIKDYSK